MDRIVVADPADGRKGEEASKAAFAECQRLYAMLGDRTLTPMQIEAVRVTMNTNFCAWRWHP